LNIEPGKIRGIFIGTLYKAIVMDNILLFKKALSEYKNLDTNVFEPINFHDEYQESDDIMHSVHSLFGAAVISSCKRTNHKGKVLEYILNNRFELGVDINSIVGHTDSEVPYTAIMPIFFTSNYKLLEHLLDIGFQYHIPEDQENVRPFYMDTFLTRYDSSFPEDENVHIKFAKIVVKYPAEPVNFFNVLFSNALKSGYYEVAKVLLTRISYADQLIYLEDAIYYSLDEEVKFFLEIGDFTEDDLRRFLIYNCLIIYHNREEAKMQRGRRGNVQEMENSYNVIFRSFMEKFRFMNVNIDYSCSTDLINTYIPPVFQLDGRISLTQSMDLVGEGMRAVTELEYYNEKQKIIRSTLVSVERPNTSSSLVSLPQSIIDLCMSF
jgi:hypothetical protein